MRFDVCVKSGTSGHYDYDACDLCIRENIKTTQLPRVGEYIMLSEEKSGAKKYLVTEVVRSFGYGYDEYNTVYVIKIF